MNGQSNSGLSAGATIEHPQSDTCAQCGAVIDPDARFCRSCGTSVAASQAQPVTPAASGPSEPSQQLADRAVGGAPVPARRVPLAVVAVVAIVAAGAGAGIALVAKGSGNGSHQIATPVRTAAPVGGKNLDASAKELARTAQTTAETIATDNGGSYEKVSLPEMHTYEKSLLTTEAEAGNNAWLSNAAGTATTFTVTTTAANSQDKFTIAQNAEGMISRTCESGPSGTGCSGEASGTW
jgi:hypothetical protein